VDRTRPASAAGTGAGAARCRAPATGERNRHAAICAGTCNGFGGNHRTASGRRQRRSACAAVLQLRPLRLQRSRRRGRCETQIAGADAGYAWASRGAGPWLARVPAAAAVAQRIAAAGFSDFLIVREGAEANSIALGRYRGEEAANKRVQALNAAGFTARAEALDGPEAAAVWLDVVAGEAFDASGAQAAIAAEQFRRIDCATARR